MLVKVRCELCEDDGKVNLSRKKHGVTIPRIDFEKLFKIV